MSQSKEPTTPPESPPPACSSQSTCDSNQDQGTHLLMSRANSVKKAIKQIMDHTDTAVSLSIPASPSASAEPSPRLASGVTIATDNHSSPEFRDLPTITTDSPSDTLSQGEQSPKPAVTFSLKLSTASSMPDLLSSSCPGKLLSKLLHLRL